MTIRALSSEERDIVLKALSATFQYFDFDFDARLGIDPEDMHRLIAAWPDIDDSDDDGQAALAINNTLNDFLHGVGLTDEDFTIIADVNRSEILQIYRKWAFARGWTSTGGR